MTESLRAAVRGDGRVLADEPMAPHTTFRIGGPADWLVYPDSIDEVRAVMRCAREYHLPCVVLGGGTNVLVRDGGVRGIVMNLSKGLRRIEVRPPSADAGQGSQWTVYAEAGAQLAAVLREAEKAGLGGLEVTAGIPGSVGGALCMNAGTRAGAIFETVESVTLCRIATGAVETMTKAELPHGYRTVEIPPGDVILAATFALTPRSREDIRNTARTLKRGRIDSQPLTLPNAGCIFKNPPGYSAGKLIDDAGLKGVHIGGAEVSSVHANFIVNAGDARAADVLALMEIIGQRVHDRFGVVLETEIRVVGDDG